jgi:hypothetical protein
MSEAPVPIVEVTVGAPIELVWQSLRDPELIKLWMGWHYDGLAAEIGVIFGKKTQANEAEHTLQLGDGDRFELFERDGGTVVRMVRAPYVAGTEWSDYYHEITEGWLSFMQQLKFMHEEHPGAERRTLFFAGTGAPEVSATLATWIPAQVGDVYYAADRQRGLTLPDLGPGLLIMGEKPPGDGKSEEAQVDAMAILTAYGLDDQQFAIECDRWTSWWRSGYPDAAPAQF